MTEDPPEAVETVVMATDQETITVAAARLALSGVATALERGDQSQIRHKQGKRDEDRETTLV
jgi:hypothetical protein